MVSQVLVDLHRAVHRDAEFLEPEALEPGDAADGAQQHVEGDALLLPARFDDDELRAAHAARSAAPCGR